MKQRMVWIATLIALAACGGGRPFMPAQAPAGFGSVERAACPKGAKGGVPIVIHDLSGLPQNRLAVSFTSSVPANLAQYQFLNASGTMTTFTPGVAATRFPIARCFPGSLGKRGARFAIPLVPGGRVWIAFGVLPITGASTGNGQFKGPSGWSKGPGFNVPWDTVELSDNNPGIFVNLTRVDMLGLPMNLRVLPPAKSKPWPVVGEDLTNYGKILQQLRSDPPFGQTVVLVRPLRVPRVINPSHLPTFPDVFNLSKYYRGGFINKVAGYYQSASISYGTAYKGTYCPGSWVATSAGGAFKFTQGTTDFFFPNPLFTANYIFSDNPAPAYTSSTCPYLLDKILIQELNRGVAMRTAHPATNPKTFYPKGTINNQYACVLHNYSLHHATYAFAYDDAAGQASALSNPAPKLVELTIGRVPRALPRPLSKRVCTTL